MLFFVADAQSLGRVATSEIVAIEIVRTLVGSIGLVLAVPVTTALATVALHPRHSADNQAHAQPTPVSWDDFGPPDDAGH
jgi:uncharacterized membrane protein